MLSQQRSENQVGSSSTQFAFSLLITYQNLIFMLSFRIPISFDALN